MEKIELEAQPRTAMGSGGARRLRRQGSVPSVLYGHGDPISISVNAKTLDKILKGSSKNILITLKMAGLADETTIIRDIQRNPVTRAISHTDFQRISLTEKITAEVHLELVGASEAVKAGGLLMQMLRSIEVECIATDIPANIQVDISGLKEFGDSVHAAALVMPAGVELVTDPEITIVTVQPPAAEEVAPAAPAEGAAAGAEPEVIAKGKEDKAEGAAGAGAAAGAKKEAAPPKK